MEDLPVDQFLSQVLEFIKAFGGLSWMMKVAGIIMLVIATMKVSFIRQYVWDKLGFAKAIVAPVLALAAGLLSMPEFSWGGIVAWLFAGAGALVLHELLDALKGIPGIGGVWVTIIEFLSSVLGGSSAPAVEKIEDK